MMSYVYVVVWGVGDVAIFGQQQCQKVTADGSRSVCKCRLVKQSTLAVALLVPQHHYGCICAPLMQYVKPYGVAGCHYSVCADGATSSS